MNEVSIGSVNDGVFVVFFILCQFGERFTNNDSSVTLMKAEVLLSKVE